MITKAISQTELRNNIKEKFDEVISNNEILIVHRGNKAKDVVIFPLDEYNSLMETLHLMSNECNRKRLLESMAEADAGKLTRINLNDI
ncbi:MAG: type II toxin-antitoxin system Phd/YefM family antitoxin [Flavobacteriaceae bacterium]|jgi:antitoxin YefM|nr:type II toxin-antitoxin system Phd/YefM family antitoxin [Flavobacteriaceae bacterium]